ncbi:hypothetical protein LEP1GSC172_2300 [Leptospira noguchii]|uniref:Uncharacterized protein n=1 Tax=Leptospira noguchii TaxID=28182 RepID=M6VJG0_9LEPT|nr:hypothetical protein LEP1GSC172_2300 [Leptospira noguchii]
MIILFKLLSVYFPLLRRSDLDRISKSYFYNRIQKKEKKL